MLCHRTAQYYFLQVAPFQHKAFRGILVCNAHYVLLYYRPSVQLHCHVMARCPNYLNTPLPCLMIRLRADKSRKERVVYVYYMVGIFAYQLLAYNLHIACKHDKRHLLFLKQLHFRLFHLSLVGMVLIYRPYMIRNAKLLGYVAQILMVTNDTRYFDIPFTGLVTRQQVVQAMTHLAHKYGHARLDIAEMQTERHVISLGIQRLDIVLKLFPWYCEIAELPLQPHEKHAVQTVYILVKIYNVTVIVGYKLCYLCYNALLVRAMKQQYCSWSHLPWMIVTPY